MGNVVERLAGATYGVNDTKKQKLFKKLWLRSLMLTTVAVLAGTPTTLHSLSMGRYMLPVAMGVIAAGLLAAIIGLFVWKTVLLETFTIVVSMGILLHDYRAAAMIDAARSWSMIVILMDLRLLFNAGASGSNFIVGITCVWIAAAEMELWKSFNLFHLVSEDERFSRIRCDDPPCPRGIMSVFGRYSLFFVTFVVDFIITRHFSIAVARQQASLEAAVNAANNVARSLADFDLEEAGSMILDTSIPPSMQQAFADLLRNLASYRPYLPDSCLPKHMQDSSTGSSSSSACMSSPKTRISSSSPGSHAPSKRSSALDTTAMVHRSRLTLLECNLVDFLSAPPDIVTAIHQKMILVLAKAVHMSNGLFDGFNGDRASASFNAAKANRRHAVAAVLASLDVRRAMEGDVKFSIGVASGSALCGVMGSTDIRRYGIVGAVGCHVKMVERWAALHGVDILCTGRTYDDAHLSVQGKLRVEQLVVEKKETVVIELWEVLGQRSESSVDEWMYQIEASAVADPWTRHNDALRLYHQGRKHEGAALLTPPLPSEELLRVFEMDLPSKYPVQEVGTPVRFHLGDHQ